MPSDLVCTNLRKSFGATTVLDGVSFALKEGECLALLGASGCGKTTLLNIIAGLFRADGGRLECGGEVLDDPMRGIHVPIAQRRFAMVFQDFSLWPHMTVMENVAFGLRLRGVGKAEQSERVRAAVERVGLTTKLGAHPGALSGGQQQRVAIARALVVEPRILLLDEPLSALDAKLRDELRDEIGTLIRRLGMTAVYVTHDQTEALTIADRIAVMRAGRIEQLDTPERIYREPANGFVATFLGVSNLLEEGRAMVRRESVEVRVGAIAEREGWVTLGGRCERCRFLGERYEVNARVGDAELRGFSAVAIGEGQTVSVSYPVDARRELTA